MPPTAPARRANKAYTHDQPNAAEGHHAFETDDKVPPSVYVGRVVTRPNNFIARYVHDALLPVVTGAWSINFVANFQRTFGVQSNGTITNHFWGIYFKLASAAGEEIFSLMPLFFWFAFPLALPFVTNFVVQLIIGQLLKDFFMLPRPASPPAPHPLSKNPIIKLQLHFETEFGMPSTHTLSGFLPQVALCALLRHGVAIGWHWWAGSALYTISVALSRLYLGVHSVHDVLAGAALGACLTTFLHFFGDHIDDVLYLSPYGVYIILGTALMFLTIYPRPKPWSACYGTSAQIYGSWLGCALCIWGLYHFNPYGLREVLMGSSVLRAKGSLYEGMSVEALAVTQAPYAYSHDLWLTSLRSTLFEPTLGGFKGDTMANTTAASASVTAATLANRATGPTPTMNGALRAITTEGSSLLMIRLILSLIITALGKVLGKAIPSLLFKQLFAFKVLGPHSDEKVDCFGQPVPLSKSYYYEVPVRLFNYGTLAAVVIFACPYSWRFIPAVP